MLNRRGEGIEDGDGGIDQGCETPFNRITYNGEIPANERGENQTHDQKKPNQYPYL